MAAPCDVNVNVTDFKQLLTEELCQEHLQVLKTFTTALQDKQFRESVEEETFLDLSRVLIRLRDHLQTTIAADREPQSVVLQLIAECFRCQRNACVENTRNQDMIRDLGFIDISLKLLNLLLSTSLETKHEPLFCGMQFLVNVAVGNQMSKNYIWQQSNPDLFLELLNVDNVKAVDYASMVLHTCLDEAKVAELSKPQNIQVALRVMELCRTHPDLDWMLFIVTEHFMKSSFLLGTMYSKMGNLDRFSLLELLYNLLKAKGSECGVGPGVALVLIDSFKTNCGATLKLSTDSPSLEAQIEKRLVDVLCEMTSGLRQFLHLQNEPELLENAVELLRQVNVADEAGKYCYSPLPNFHSSDTPVSEFKAQLIRLITNLCYKHFDNQNKVRELEGIPLILEYCKMGNSPLLSQTAIFAISVLLKHNKQNQEVVDSIRQHQGLSFNFSLFTHEDDDTSTGQDLNPDQE